MRSLPFLLSVVVVVRNRTQSLRQQLGALHAHLARRTDSYELLVVDNASSDGSLRVLEGLAEPGGFAALQVYALEAPVEREAATWVGVERAAGDAVAVLELTANAPAALDAMLPQLEDGVDLVLAAPEPATPRRGPARLAKAALRKLVFGAANQREVRGSRNRLLRRRVVNALARQPVPDIAFRDLAADETLRSKHVTFAAPAPALPTPGLAAALDDAVRVCVSRSRRPLRLATGACAFAAFGNLLYTGYVVTIALLGRAPAPGWTSTALQQAGTAFLLATVGATATAYLTHVLVPALRPRAPVVRACYASVEADVHGVDGPATADARPYRGATAPSPSPQPGVH